MSIIESEYGVCLSRGLYSQKIKYTYTVLVFM